MTSSSGKQIITIHMLSSISRSKGSQTMKCGQSIEIRNISRLKNHTQNVLEKLVSDPFLKI